MSEVPLYLRGGKIELLVDKSGDLSEQVIAPAFYRGTSPIRKSS